MQQIPRESELTALYDQVISREDILLYAPSGSGKTHLCQLLIPKLQDRRICFYLSMRGLLSLQSWYEELIYSIKNSSAHYPNVDYQLKRFFAEQAPPTGFEPRNLKNYLDQLAATLERISQDFLFIFEDIHEWEPDLRLGDLFTTLSTPKNCQLLLTSAYVPEGFEFTTAQNLPPIDLQHLKAALALPDETLQPLLDFSRGNAAFLLDLLKEGAAASMELHQAAGSVLQHHHSLFYIFRKRFTPLQWKLLCAIANEGVVKQPHAFDFLVKHNLGAASSVERALQNLISSQMVTKKEDGWMIEQVVFERWLQWVYSRH